MKCFHWTGCCFPSFPCSPCSPCFPNSLLLCSKMAEFHNLWSPGFTSVNLSGYLAAHEIIILLILKIIYTGERCWYYCLPVRSTRRAAKSDPRKFWLRYPSNFGKMNPDILDLNFSWLYFYHGSVASPGAAYNHTYQPAKQELMSPATRYYVLRKPCSK